jgi:prepilin-type N-terminal cleavage/methylation domain-containing protein
MSLIAKTSRGFTIIELTITLVVISILTAHFMRTFYLPGIEKVAAREAGRHAAVYSFSVQRRLSQEGTGILGGAGSLTFNGDEWLKNGCAGGYGTAPAAYLDCDFDPVNPWGDTYTVNVSEPNTGRVRAEIEIEGPKPLVSGSVSTLADVDQTLVNVMRNTASSQQPGMTPISTMFYDVRVEDVDGNGLDDTMVIVSSTELALDIYLRVDGANNMEADLDINNNDVVNVSNLQAQSGTFSDFITVSGGGWGAAGSIGAGFATSPNALMATSTDVRIMSGDSFEVQANNLLQLQTTNASVTITPTNVLALSADGLGNDANLQLTDSSATLLSNNGTVNASVTLQASLGASATLDIQSSNLNSTATGIFDFMQIGGSLHPDRGTLIGMNDNSMGYIANKGVIEVLDFDNGAGLQNGVLAFADSPGAPGVEVSNSDNYDLRVTGTGTNEATLIVDNVYEPTLNRYLDQAIFDKTVIRYTGNYIEIPKPTCKAGRTAQIFATSSGSVHDSRRPILATDIEVVSTGTGWQLRGVVWVDTDTSKTRLYENEMTIVVDRKCT